MSKTRGYSDLSVVAFFLYLAAMGAGLFGVYSYLLAATDSGRHVFSLLVYGSMSFGIAILYVCVAGLLRLSRHVADDLYMLRLIAQNEWRERHQGTP